MAESELPMIRFAGGWISAAEAWSRMQTAMAALDNLERFNASFPDLATKETLAVVPAVRARLRSIGLALPRRPEQAAAIRTKALALLERSSPEEVVDALQKDFGGELNLSTLIAVAGNRAYLGALAREARELLLHKISAEQAALLWNDLGRPSAGGDPWTAAAVLRLLADTAA
jgi:hypothetical protein